MPGKYLQWVLIDDPLSNPKLNTATLLAESLGLGLILLKGSVLINCSNLISPLLVLAILFSKSNSKSSVLSRILLLSNL